MEPLTDFQPQSRGRVETGLLAGWNNRDRRHINLALPWRRVPAWLRERLTALD